MISTISVPSFGTTPRRSVTTVLLLVAFVTSVGIVFVFGPPDLLAAP